MAPLPLLPQQKSLAPFVLTHMQKADPNNRLLYNSVSTKKESYALT